MQPEENQMTNRSKYNFPNAQKVQVFEQVDTYIENNQPINTTEQTFEILLTNYKQFIDEIQQKYPNLADETAVTQIIDVEAKRIETKDQQRWQNFLSLKCLWNGGKKASIKVGEHFAENNVWAKGAIAFLEGISEDVK